MTKNLITSKIDYIFFKNNFFLINIGLLKNKNKILNSRNVLPDVWSKKKIAEKSINYIEKLNSKILFALAKNLGSFHKTTNDKNYWGVILFHWLNSYLCRLYKQWVFIESIKEKYNILQYSYRRDDFYPNDFLEANFFYTQYSWNSKLITDIINYKNSKYFNIQIKKNKLYPDKIIYNKKLINFTIIDILKKAVSAFKKEKSFYFFDNYIPTIFKIKLYTALKDRIFIDDKKFTAIYERRKFKANYIFRKKKLDFLINNSFEEFVSKKIMTDIPISYLENFNYFLQLSQDSLKPRFIFSSNAYRSNDYFKIWAAEKYKKYKSKIIYVSHGAEHLNPLLKNESKFCYKKITFDTASKKNEVQLPYSWFYSKIVSKKNYEEKNLLLMVNTNPINNWEITNGTNSIDQTVKIYNSFKSFVCKFNNMFNNEVVVREIKSPKENTTQFCYIKNFLGKSISYSDPLKTNLKEEFLNTNLSISLDFGTFTIQSMHAVPTLIFLTKDFVIKKKYRFAVENLKKNNILFYNHEKMFNHVRKIFHEPLIWWESADVIKSRNIFYKTFGFKHDNTVNKWLDFCRGLLK
jgi:putative transferase (TIGR04331 family)